MSWRVLSKRRSLCSPGVLIILLGWLFIGGCGGQATSEPSQPVVPVSTTAISSLQDPATKNSTIYLKGTVGTIVPLLEGTVYELQDSSGKIWVLTQQSAPKSGQEVVVKGTVRYKPISINGQEQGSIYLEQE